MTNAVLSLPGRDRDFPGVGSAAYYLGAEHLEVVGVIASRAWKKTAVAAIHALEAQEPAESESCDAAQAALATELKARQMDLLERKLRLKALRAQRLELYSLNRHHQIGDDVLREMLAELDMSEANLGQVK